VSRDYLIALGAGLLSALFYLSVKMGSPGAIILAYMSQLPLFVIGLSLGLIPTAIACLVAAAAIAVSANFSAAGLFLAVTAGPVLLLVRQLLQSRPGSRAGVVEWYPPGRLLGALTGYGLVMLVAASLILAGSEGGLLGVARTYIDTALGTMPANGADPRLEALIGSFVRYFPSVVVTTWLLMVIANGVLAQGLLVRFKFNRRPSPKFTELELPAWLTVGLVVSAGMSMVSGQIGMIGQNALVIMALPFFLLGLSVAHVLSRRFPARGFFLATTYAMLLFVGLPAIIFMSGLGIIEQWTRLRQRFAVTTGSEEDE
jgi:hypothetical protein